MSAEPLQRTHLQRPLLKMSPTAGNETSKGKNPENGRRRDFGRRRRHRQSGFQHTDRPRPFSPELSNKDHNAGRESLSHLNNVFGTQLGGVYRIKFCNKETYRHMPNNNNIKQKSSKLMKFRNDYNNAARYCIRTVPPLSKFALVFVDSEFETFIHYEVFTLFLLFTISNTISKPITVFTLQCTNNS